jgi:hypothetical protein
LNAFSNQVNAYVNSGTLTAAEGQSLLDAVNALESELGCQPEGVFDERGRRRERHATPGSPAVIVEDRQSCLSGLSTQRKLRTGRIACPPLVQRFPRKLPTRGARQESA